MHPERFVTFASVALQFPDLAAQQLSDADKHAILGGNTAKLLRLAT